MRDPLFENKFAASLLVAALIIFAGPIAFDRLFGEERERRVPPPKDATIDIASDEAFFFALYETADPARGERRMGLCLSCHTVERGAADAVGPNLWGVYGAPIAARQGYNYSTALRALEGEWTPEKLNRFLENSQDFAPGSLMFMVIRDPQSRAEIVKYLSTLSDEPRDEAVNERQALSGPP